MKPDSPKIICWGEILWDVFEDHSVIGGAPFNVAQRLHSFGVSTLMVSTIGHDQLGENVLDYMRQKGLSTRGVSRHDHLATGRVNVILDHQGSARYTIEDPAAWDDINVNNKIEPLMEFAQVLVFGSLALRHQPNQISLNDLLKYDLFMVFDVNLRPPHFDLSWIKDMIKKADLVKMNDEELDYLFATTTDFQECDSIDEKCVQLSAFDPNKIWCVTLGGAGARLFVEGFWYAHSGYVVEVMDTVGAGDSFLAALIQELIIEKRSPEQALDAAVKIGSIVAAKAGANPEISTWDLNNLISK